MTSKSDIITKLIDEAAPRIAVVFSGEVPRLIGTLETAESATAIKPLVDSMLLSQGLSATYISRATCRYRDFVVAHS